LRSVRPARTRRADARSHGFGIVEGGQKLAGLLIFVNDIHALGLKTAQGLIFTDPWYWDQNDTNRAFAVGC